MIHTLLNGKKIILASQSPRRKEIFDLIGIKALQVPANINEELVTNIPRKLVQIHAKNKALAVQKLFDEDCVIVAADTIVYLDKKILGKPADKMHAAEYLSHLSGNIHYVYTGVAIVYKNQVITDFTKSRVEFHNLSAQEIEEYLNTGEPFDKAGAYGIQGYGSQFIKKISGCYFNVMGFPVSLFHQMLKRIL